MLERLGDGVCLPGEYRNGNSYIVRHEINTNEGQFRNIKINLKITNTHVYALKYKSSPK